MIRGQKRALEKQPSVNLNASIHNRFDIEVVDAKTGKVKQRAQAENVICDYMWTVLLLLTTSDSGKWSSYIHYGSGSGTPAASDTSLFNYVGYGTPSTSDDVKNFDAINHVASLRRKIVLSEQTAVGVEITEVGISNVTSGEICTHAMLQDMNGNQISILKADTDIINIYATIYAHWSGDKDDWFAFSNYEGSNGFFQWLLGTTTVYGAAPGVSLSGNSKGSASLSRSGILLSTEEKSMTITYSRLSASSGNNGAGGYSFLLSNDWLFRINPNWFNVPRITGEAIGTGDGTTVDFYTTFRDISDAIVYVDGEVADVSVDAALPLSPDSDIPSALIPRNLDGTLMVTSIGTGVTLGSYVYVSPPSNGVLENPNNSVFGITKVNAYHASGAYHSLTLYASDDMINWTLIAGPTLSEITIPEELRRSRYFKTVITTSTNSNYWRFTPDVATEYNIHFAEAPADGAVITADYTPGVIAKDENHVFDFQIKFTLGEYTE